MADSMPGKDRTTGSPSVFQPASPVTILYRRLRELLDQGAQLVEVLPEAEYNEQHLPGAINIPLKLLDVQTTRQLDRRRDIVVYCWDAL